MAFYITENGQPTNVILTDGGSIEVGENLSVDENGKLNAQAGTEVYVDDELSLESENPVQNKVITKTIEDVEQVTAAALNDLNDKKADRDELAQVAFTGDYNDLENKPAIPEDFVQQQVDWNATSGVTSIANKPNLATVATSGDYNDLSNKPEVEQSDWNENDSSSPAFIKNKPSNLGALDNIEVNGIEGTVENKVASVDITGLDVPVGEDFVESELTNEELEISATDDTVSDALGKLQKAVKDDEEVTTKAFFAIKNSTGFTENLEYQTVEDPNNLLYDVTDLQQADTKLAGYIKNLQDFISNNTFKITVNGVNYLVLKPQGSTQTGVTINTPDSASKINNITRLYPAQATVGQPYYDLTSVLSLADLPDVSLGTSPGTCYTWEESSGIWVMYQYVGPNETAVSWKNSDNWIKRW